MRSIWTGAIGFGLVNIPIKLYSATEESSLDLDMLDKKDHANIRFRRVNEHTGKEVAWGDIVKGYKLDDRYVVLTDEDFQKASPEKTKIIEIKEFVIETEIDGMYYETPYYLEPDKSGGKAYLLLRDALHKTGKVAFGSFVLRNKESLCLLKPVDEVLVLYKIRWQQEVRSTDDLSIPSGSSKPAELKMAIQLIDQLSGPFDITKYKDTYSDELMKLIQAKAKGRKPKMPVLKVVHRQGKDLLSQLKASLQGSGSTRKRRAS
ncbi:MAG: Ku protein [Sphingobacteriales bacterium 50-39]|nr:Ku protein [Sphingobacteriales bacterium]OJW61189.1 MAG: Ku protein [Sphingobacteriales bacterium 50-39]